MFKCKQFTVQQNNCAMKVNTDSLILGSWATINQARQVLDIGTGTGILALMMAQRTMSEAIVEAIDIDEGAVLQARQNVAASPWPNKVKVSQCDITQHAGKDYDLIITNPPYFTAQHKPSAAYRTQSRQREQARQYISLTPETLFAAMAARLSPAGRGYCLYPTNYENETRRSAQAYGLTIQAILRVSHSHQSSPYVNAYCFGLASRDTTEEALIIRDADGSYTEQYKHLCRPFYLKF